MGCGAYNVQQSICTQKDTLPRSPIPQPHILYENPFLYLFGINHQGKQQIIKFDAQNETFSNIPVPENMKTWNYSQAIMLNSYTIFITGGINKELSEISDQAGIYFVQTNQFKILPSLKYARYTHASIIKDQNKLYVIGGRTYGDDNEAILASVECLLISQYFQLDKENLQKQKETQLSNKLESHNNKLDITEEINQKPQQNLQNLSDIQDKIQEFQWMQLAPLNQARCTCFTAILHNQIYVFGGYSGPLKRSRQFEHYCEEQDKWEILNVSLQRGIECGLLLAGFDPYQFYIIGGQIRGGPTKTIHLFNLKDQTVHYKSSLLNSRVLQKGICYHNILYIFGGDNSNIVEISSIKNWEWNDLQPKQNFTDYCSSEFIEKFAQSQRPVVIKGEVDEFLIQQQQSNNYQINKVGLIDQVPLYKRHSMQVCQQQQNCQYSLKRRNSQDIQQSNLGQFNGNNSFLINNSNYHIKYNSKLFSKSNYDIKSCNQHQQHIINQHLNNEVVYLFGNDDKPFILEFNITKMTAQNRAVPLQLQLYCFQAGVQISSNIYFLCGGIQSQLDKISKKTIVINVETNLVAQCNKMSSHRYLHCCIMREDFIYAIGGLSYSSDGNGDSQQDVESSCERFNLSTGEWEDIAPMNTARHSFMCFNAKKGIIVFGGFNGVERETTFEQYNNEQNIWTCLPLQLQDGLEGATLHVYNEERLLILGGRNNLKEINLAQIIDLEKLSQSCIGDIGIPRSMHKSYKLSTLYSDYILIFGGNENNSIESFSLKKKQIDDCIDITPLNQLIEDFKFELEMAIGDNTTIKQLLLL